MRRTAASTAASRLGEGRVAGLGPRWRRYRLCMPRRAASTLRRSRPAAPSRPRSAAQLIRPPPCRRPRRRGASQRGHGAVRASGPRRPSLVRAPDLGHADRWRWPSAVERPAPSFVPPSPRPRPGRGRRGVARSCAGPAGMSVHQSGAYLGVRRSSQAMSAALGVPGWRRARRSWLAPKRASARRSDRDVVGVYAMLRDVPSTSRAIAGRPLEHIVGVQRLGEGGQRRGIGAQGGEDGVHVGALLGHRAVERRAP